MNKTCRIAQFFMTGFSIVQLANFYLGGTSIRTVLYIQNAGKNRLVEKHKSRTPQFTVQT